MSTFWEEGWCRSVRVRVTRLWRGVEAQHLVSTMKLVDTPDEQQQLEHILEASKPALPRSPKGRTQHYLLSTPFRYPSPHASRFRPAGALGIWYGAETVETACTELAYWRWRFLMDSDGLRPTELIAEFTLFRATAEGLALDLTEDPWDRMRRHWIADDYSACHALAREARERQVQWIRYWSARRAESVCGAVLEPQTLSAPELNRQQTWVCKVTERSAFMRHREEVLTLSFPG